MRPLVVSMAALVVATSGCRSERTTSDGGASTSTTLDARGTTSLLAEVAMARALVPGLAYAAFTKESERVGAAGLSDVARRLDARADTVFEAASIAKLVVATSVMQLVEAGALDLEADVSTYVGFAVHHPRWPERITLRLLLTHRASIRDLGDELTAGASGNPLGPFLKRYLSHTEAFTAERPGSTLAYSNAGAALAAFAVERVSGESFVTYSTRRVFTPLRMTRTSWAQPDQPSSGMATPYGYRDGAFVALAPPSHAVYPAVDLLATAGDLARFARAILRGGELDGARILSAERVHAMLRADASASDQAIGWQLRTIGGRAVVGHEGEDAGATTGLYLDLARGTGALVLANGDAFGSGDKLRAEAIETMISELLATTR